ncbi:odorant receptor 49b-like [Uranotaenia lowii]|uniref:odorant receptor 49b-like n=1 Tax=Uranotaenia lowii TaxID=190385 RepID=UPI002478BBF1|nr:odorant receptor 49b-like [Uranotaenia lowii]
MYALIPIIVVVMAYFTNREINLPSLLNAEFLFFDFRSSTWIWAIVIIVTIVLSVIMTSAVAGLDFFMWSILFYICVLFRIVRIKIENLNMLDETECLTENMTKIIQLHDLTFRNSAKVEDAMRNFIFLLHGICVGAFCMSMVVVSIEQNNNNLLLNMLILLLLMVFQIFCYSMLGSEIESQSNSVADALYTTDWYSNRKQQFAILFMLMRSQKTSSLHAAKFFVVTRESFMAALRMAFSYYTILRQVYDQ